MLCLIGVRERLQLYSSLDFQLSFFLFHLSRGINLHCSLKGNTRRSIRSNVLLIFLYFNFVSKKLEETKL